MDCNEENENKEEEWMKEEVSQNEAREEKITMRRKDRYEERKQGRGKVA